MSYRILTCAFVLLAALPVMADEPTPEVFMLEPPTPDPFCNDATTLIRVQSPRAGEAKLFILGPDEHTIVRWLTFVGEWDFMDPGIHDFHWDGRDDNGALLPDETYLVHFEAAECWTCDPDFIAQAYVTIDCPTATDAAPWQRIKRWFR